MIIMLKEFIEYTYQVFPSIDTSHKNAISNLLSQFETAIPNWFNTTELSELAQGDIIEKLPFSHIKANGEEEVIITKGMVLSNTCDLQRDSNIVIAPLIPFERDFSPNAVCDLKKNIFSGKLCLKDSSIEDLYVDFSQSTSFNRDIVKKLLADKKTTREYSLSQFGFYFLCTKLTIYYLRVETKDFFDTRNEKMFI